MGGPVGQFAIRSAWMLGAARVIADVVVRKIDLSQIITHRLALADAPRGYELFQKKKDGCIKVVLTP